VARKLTLQPTDLRFVLTWRLPDALKEIEFSLFFFLSVDCASKLADYSFAGLEFMRTDDQRCIQSF
jgi:hypothetical protein